jgi:alkylhydroperoxidase/carboxymuconolactone decarboxylase family protein YurZ
MVWDDPESCCRYLRRRGHADLLGLKFAYSTNGQAIIEFDLSTGIERELDTFPSPSELWARFAAEQLTSDSATGRLLVPANLNTVKEIRHARRRPSNGRSNRSSAGTPSTSYDRYGNGKDGGGVPDLLDALDLAMKPDRRTLQASDPVSRGSEFSGRRSEGQNFRPLWLKTRSMITMAALVALRRGAELRVHMRGALNLGITHTELKEMIFHLSQYSGVPNAVEAIRAFTEVTAPKK